MELLDNRKIAFEVAYDISFIKEEEKQYLIAEMIEAGHGVDIKKSTLIHDYAKKGKLTEELLRQIITGENEGCKEWQPETHQNQGDSHQQIF